MEVNERPNRRRPRSVVILAFLQILQSASLIGVGVYRLIYEGVTVEWVILRMSDLALPFTTRILDVMRSGVGLILLGFPLLVIALALLSLNRWAWFASISLQGVGLFSSLLAYFHNQPNYLAMLQGVVLVLYMGQKEIQSAFQQDGGE